VPGGGRKEKKNVTAQVEARVAIRPDQHWKRSREIRRSRIRRVQLGSGGGPERGNIIRSRESILENDWLSVQRGQIEKEKRGSGFFIAKIS
jgi:hypothetical protein